MNLKTQKRACVCASVGVGGSRNSDTMLKPRSHGFSKWGGGLGVGKAFYPEGGGGLLFFDKRCSPGHLDWVNSLMAATGPTHA